VPGSGEPDVKHVIAAAPDKTTLVDLELSGNPRCLALVRRLLEASAHSLPLGQTLLNDIKIAVTEACTNVIKHAFKYDASRRFGVSLRISPARYQINVVYEDAGFDPAAIPLPDLNNVREGGLGVYIIRNIMDDVVYSTDPPTGTVTLSMVKLLKTTSATGGQM